MSGYHICYFVVFLCVTIHEIALLVNAQNSVFQVLLNCTDLILALLDENIDVNVDYNTKFGFNGEIFKMFKNTLYEYLKANARTDILVPVKAMSCFKSLKDKSSFNIFANGQQHDASEFLVMLIDGLHEDLNTGVCSNFPLPGYDSGFTDTEVIDCIEKIEKIFLSKKNGSIISKLFSGLSKNTLSCVCGHKRISFETFFGLLVPIDKKLELFNGTAIKKQRTSFTTCKTRYRMKLEDCLQEYLKEEKLGDDAPRCICRRTFNEKKIDLCHVPNYLTITIKRFDDNGKRLDDIIEYPIKGLDLKEMKCANFCKENKNVQYMFDLYAVINHKGTHATRGHYTATINYNGGWCEISDANFKGQAQPVTADAYILFYKRVDA